MAFSESDVVRIARLLEPTRRVDGTEGVARQPRVGDIGAVVHVLGEDTFVVECVDPSGLTQWVAEFVAEELEPASHAEQPRS